MALPPDFKPISNELIDYLNTLVQSNGATNPENLRTVLLFFDAQEPRVYHRPGMPTAELIGNNTQHLPATEVNRVESVSTVVFQRNPTCSWVVVNGSHRRYCG